MPSAANGIFKKSYEAARKAGKMTTETACTRFEAVREVLADKKNILTVKELCELAGVSRSGYYRWIGAEKARELREAKESGVYEFYYLNLATGLRRGELLGLK